MPSRKWKVAFVSPRWAPEAAGGAEVHARLLAERLAVRGHRVDALATCAENPHTWKNERRAGTERVNGVTVHRFPVDPGRMSREFLGIQGRISSGHRVTRGEEERWIAGSVVSSELSRFIEERSGEFDAFVFIPYLFGTTWFGSSVCPAKSLLIPCLHDEPFAKLSIYRDMFGRFRGLLFNTLPEMELARRLYGVPDEKSCLVSLGFEEPRGFDPERFRRKRGLESPFLLYAGRREEGKNTHLLVEYFRLYRRRRGDRLSLVLIGTGDVPLLPEDRGGIVDFGYVSAGEKLDAMAAALAFCQPSTNESLGIVVMESWLAGRPVLVHGDCAVTRDHTERSGGGLWFDDYFTFEACLDWFLENSEAAAVMAVQGKAYVRENYSWDAVLDHFEEALERFLP